MTHAIRHGYTLHQLNQLARRAARHAPAHSLDSYTRYSLAWSAIAEHLVTTHDIPTRRDLVRIGWQAINDETRACMHARGYAGGHAHNGPASSPRYMQYWHTPRDDGAIERVIEHLAAVQIGDTLTHEEGRAVEALAMHGDYQQAAFALGVSYGRLASRLTDARRRFCRHWYAPDTAPPRTGHDKRRGSHPPRAHCSAGHEMTDDNVRVRRRKGGRVERVCRACERGRSVTRRRVPEAVT